MEKMWEELHELVKRGIFVEVAHVKAHRKDRHVLDDLIFYGQ